MEFLEKTRNIYCIGLTYKAHILGLLGGFRIRLEIERDNMNEKASFGAAFVWSQTELEWKQLARIEFPQLATSMNWAKVTTATPRPPQLSDVCFAEFVFLTNLPDDLDTLKKIAGIILAL